MTEQEPFLVLFEHWELDFLSAHNSTTFAGED